MLFVNRMLIIPVAAVNAHRDDDWYMFPLFGTDSWKMYAYGVQYLITLYHYLSCRITYVFFVSTGRVYDASFNRHGCILFLFFRILNYGLSGKKAGACPKNTLFL